MHMHVFVCVIYVYIYSRETGEVRGKTEKGCGGRHKGEDREGGRERDGQTEERVGCQETAKSGGQRGVSLNSLNVWLVAPSRSNARAASTLRPGARQKLTGTGFATIRRNF